MDRPVLVSNPTDTVAEYAAIPDCNLYNREGLQRRRQASLMTTAKVSTNNCGFPPFGTRSVRLSERKSSRLLPKRHQIKHLKFVVSWFGTRRSEVQILSPRPRFCCPSCPQLIIGINCYLPGAIGFRTAVFRSSLAIMR
jgi:hypothetical protein